MQNGVFAFGEGECVIGMKIHILQPVKHLLEIGVKIYWKYRQVGEGENHLRENLRLLLQNIQADFFVGILHRMPPGAAARCRSVFVIWQNFIAGHDIVGNFSSPEALVSSPPEPFVHDWSTGIYGTDDL